MRLVTVLFLLGLLYPAYGNQASNSVKTEFLKYHFQFARVQMIESRIPVSITLAQAIVESGWGKSKLAIEGNNYFGLKCFHESCKSRAIYKKDDTYDDNGNLIEEPFINFERIEDAYMHRTQRFYSNEVYLPLFELDMMDYKGWAHQLKKSGYATAEDYAENLIRIIEENKLQIYDQQVKREMDQLKQIEDMVQDDLLAASQQATVTKKEQVEIAMEEPEKLQISTDNFMTVPQNPKTDTEAVAANYKPTDVSNYTPPHLRAQSTHDNTTQEKGGKSTNKKIVSDISSDDMDVVGLPR